MTEKRGRVLIVDDEVFFREAIGEILADANFETRTASTGKSALEMIESSEIGAVVLDVRMPDLDGIQVLACIREARPELPVIMLSSSTDQEIVLEALRLGANDYLAKPLHDEELVLAVGRALDGFEVVAAKNRIQSRIDRLVEEMERLSQLVRLAPTEDRVLVLRQGVVNASAEVLEASRISLMLVDPDQETLRVVAMRGADLELEAMNPKKVGEGASGIAFAESVLLCVGDASRDERFAGQAAGVYESGAFAVVPLVCLGVPVGVLCASEGEDGEDRFLEETNILRLLGMQISEFLAADPDVEILLQQASGIDVEGVEPTPVTGIDGDAELARVVCEAIAAEAEPDRMLQRALSGASQHLRAAPVSVYVLSPDGSRLTCELSVDGGIASDRSKLPARVGFVGQVVQSGQLVAVDAPDADERFSPRVDTAVDGKVRPYLCVPLKLRGKVVGIFRAFLDEGRVSARTGEVLGAAFSAALRNVLLYRSLRKSIEDVADARRAARGE